MRFFFQVRLETTDQILKIPGDNPDALKPHEVHYHMPKYLRGVPGRENDYQQGLRLKNYLAETAVPDVRPKEWEFLCNRVRRRYSELRIVTNQERFKNYKGIKCGPSPDRFKSKKF